MDDQLEGFDVQNAKRSKKKKVKKMKEYRSWEEDSYQIGTWWTVNKLDFFVSNYYEITFRGDLFLYNGRVQMNFIS